MDTPFHVCLLPVGAKRYSGTPTELLDITWKTEPSSDQHRQGGGDAAHLALVGTPRCGL